MNEMDQDVWTSSGKGSFGSDLRRCGMQCLANGGPCVSTCFQKDPGYSVDCSDCIGEMAECTKNNCLGDCISGDDAKSVDVDAGEDEDEDEDTGETSSNTSAFSRRQVRHHSISLLSALTSRRAPFSSFFFSGCLPVYSGPQLG